MRAFYLLCVVASALCSCALSACLECLCVAAGQGTMAAPRLLCVLGADASAEVIEEFVSPASEASDPHVTNALAEIELAEGACIKHG